MTTLKTYPAYKDSGVDWLGNVPNHWEQRRLKTVATTERFIVQAADYELPYIGLEHIQSWTGRKLGELPSSQVAGQAIAFSSEHVLFGKLRPYLAKVHRPSERGVASTEFLALASENLNRDYLFRLLLTNSFIDLVNSSTFGARMPRADWEFIGNVTVPLPPLDEQRAIADFLDGMDARITRFIAARRKMIALLEEKKQAVINQAVTRGLDPSVPMKDSGVDWLGEIPTHWTIAKIRQVAALESGHTPDRTVPDYWLPTNDIPWVSLKDTATLKKQDYISETANYVNEMGLANSSARLLPARTVVFTRDATIGKAAITTRPMAVSQHLIAWVPGPDLYAEYLLHVLYAMEPHLNQLTFGATIRTIGMDDVRTMTMPVPPLQEQVDIANYVQTERLRIDSLITRHRREIGLIQEYRTRLISDVVTGKLDVRGVELPAVEAVIGEEIEAAMESEVDEEEMAWSG